MDIEKEIAAIPEAEREAWLKNKIAEVNASGSERQEWVIPETIIKAMDNNKLLELHHLLVKDKSGWQDLPGDMAKKMATESGYNLDVVRAELESREVSIGA